MAAALLVLPAHAADETDDFELLMSKIRADKLYVPAAATIVADTTDMAADGSYADIDYTKRDRTNWQPLTHVDRLVTMAHAYVHAQSPFRGDHRLYTKIVAGLQYWYDVNPYCSNWWYNQIAEPQRLGVLLILMRAGSEQVPATLESETIERWRKDGGNPSAQTGANRTDVALHWLYRGCLTRSEDVLTTALRYLYDPLRYTSGEGFQVDNSYFQHGQQLYIGGYGDALLASVLPVAGYTAGTRFALDSARVELLGRFVRETFTDVIRGRTSQFDCLGRGMARIGALRKTSNWLNYVRRMQRLDTAHAARYDTILLRLDGRREASYGLRPKHTHYYRGDYTLHVRPAYHFSVRLASTRTCRNEYGNGENLKTYFLSDGATCITRTGEEYYDLMPLWDWNRLPGTTAPRLSSIPKAASDWQTKGTSTFAGGVSDSIYGATGYDYYDTYNNINTGGKKGWFFFDREVVCLGADIRSAGRAFTTVDQCYGADTLRIGFKSGLTLGLNRVTSDRTYRDSTLWVLHRGVGYAFPQGGRVVLNNKNVTGQWSVINTTEPNTTVRSRVFTLALDHLYPRSGGGEYAYIVMPGTTEEELTRYMADCPIEVAANTDSVQVVHHRGLGLYAMVFFKAARFRSDSLSVRVSAPCALLFKQVGGERLTFHVADPAQARQSIEVGVQTPALGTMRRATVDFSALDTEHAGATLVASVDAGSEVVSISPKHTAAALRLSLPAEGAHAGRPFELSLQGGTGAVVEAFAPDGTCMARHRMADTTATLSLPAAGLYLLRARSARGVAAAKIWVQP